MEIIVAGGGITGVSAAEWLHRDGHDVTLIDRIAPGDSGQASYGNAGILSRCAVVPVPVPGLWKKAPKMLLDPDGPLFLRWSYLPRLLPWLIPFLRNGRRDKVEAIAGALAPLIGDTVEQHRSLARGTPAERWITTGEYSYLYPDRAAFQGDAFGFALRKAQGFEWEERTAIACWRSTPISARTMPSPPPSRIVAGSPIRAAMWPTWRPGSRARAADCVRRRFRKSCRSMAGAPPGSPAASGSRRTGW